MGVLLLSLFGALLGLLAAASPGGAAVSSGNSISLALPGFLEFGGNGAFHCSQFFTPERDIFRSLSLWVGGCLACRIGQGDDRVAAFGHDRFVVVGVGTARQDVGNVVGCLGCISGGRGREMGWPEVNQGGAINGGAGFLRGRTVWAWAGSVKPARVLERALVSTGLACLGFWALALYDVGLVPMTSSQSPVVCESLVLEDIASCEASFSGVAAGGSSSV